MSFVQVNKDSPKVRSTGESPSTEDIINVAKLFDDDLTLDNLSRPQLTSICRYMGLNAFGTDNFLRGAVRSRLLQIRRDDQAILAEGADELSTSELQNACQSRGIRTYGVSPARLREDLSTWINLHLHERVSGVLLILGRAFEFDRKLGEDENSRMAVVRSLEYVLSGLPDNLVRSILITSLLDIVTDGNAAERSGAGSRLGKGVLQAAT
jgi:LETM1 and EF-hand domain-containing protein 1, mitochondrial